VGQRTEDALLLDEETLMQCHDDFAIVNRHANAAVDQIVKVLLDFKLDPETSRDFVRIPKLIFQSILKPLCKDWQQVKRSFGRNAPQVVERSKATTCLGIYATPPTKH
jgi:hypothetical protein